MIYYFAPTSTAIKKLKKKKKKVLAKMWRKWNSCALTVRLQNGADTEEDSLVILQKVEKNFSIS